MIAWNLTLNPFSKAMDARKHLTSDGMNTLPERGGCLSGQWNHRVFSLIIWMPFPQIIWLHFLHQLTQYLLKRCYNIRTGILQNLYVNFLFPHYYIMGQETRFCFQCLKHLICPVTNRIQSLRYQPIFEYKTQLSLLSITYILLKES